MNKKILENVDTSDFHKQVLENMKEIYEGLDGLGVERISKGKSGPGRRKQGKRG